MKTWKTGFWSRGRDSVAFKKRPTNDQKETVLSQVWENVFKFAAVTLFRTKCADWEVGVATVGSPAGFTTLLRFKASALGSVCVCVMLWPVTVCKLSLNLFRCLWSERRPAGCMEPTPLSAVAQVLHLSPVWRLLGFVLKHQDSSVVIGLRLAGVRVEGQQDGAAGWSAVLFFLGGVCVRQRDWSETSWVELTSVA